MAREAQVYCALAGTGARIPALHAVADDGRVLLADRAAGTHELDQLDEGQRAVMFDDFIDSIAELHAVDESRLDLASYRRAVDGPAHFALRVLRACAPERVDGYTTRIELEAIDTDGCRLEVTGRCVDRLANQATPSQFAWMSMTE